MYENVYTAPGTQHTTTINLSSIVVWDFLPPLVMTSLLEQAPDWLTRREYPPKFRFFNSRESGEKNAHAPRIAPQDCLSRLCIDLTCKSFTRFASFASGVNAPLERQNVSEVKMGRGSPICEKVHKKILEYFKNNVNQHSFAKALQISSST